MKDLLGAYAPLLGAPIKTVAWLPMWCDTPRVTASLEKQNFSFSGGLLLVSESDQQVCLTREARAPTP